MKSKDNPFVQLRKAFAITQEELAGFLGVSRSTLANVEMNRKSLGLNASTKFSILSACMVGALAPKSKTVKQKPNSDLQNARKYLANLIKSSELELDQLKRMLVKHQQEYQRKMNLSIRLSEIKLSDYHGLDASHDDWQLIIGNRLKQQLSSNGLKDLMEQKLKMKIVEATILESRKLISELDTKPY